MLNFNSSRASDLAATRRFGFAVQPRPFDQQSGSLSHLLRFREPIYCTLVDCQILNYRVNLIHGMIFEEVCLWGAWSELCNFWQQEFRVHQVADGFGDVLPTGQSGPAAAGPVSTPKVCRGDPPPQPRAILRSATSRRRKAVTTPGWRHRDGVFPAQGPD